MKELTRSSRTAGYLEKMFRALNAEYFDGALDEPIITMQNTPKAWGHVSKARIWQVKESNLHELNIDAGALNRPIENLTATMIHEMVHLYCIANEIQDASRNGTYHNKRFKAEAEKRAIQIEHDKTSGYSVTSPTPELCDFVIKQGWQDITMTRWGLDNIKTGGSSGSKDPEKGKEEGGEKKKSSTRKYQCPCCGQSVRATKAVNILCGNCMETMLEV